MSNFELFKSIIIPIATFILGFAVNRIFVWFDKKKQIGNIRSILIKEMIENCNELTQSTNIRDTIKNVSSSVYDNYLGRICELRKEEVNLIHRAYRKMGIKKRLIEGGENIELAHKNGNEILNALGDALEIFENDNEEVKECLKKVREYLKDPN